MHPSRVLPIQTAVAVALLAAFWPQPALSGQGESPLDQVLRRVERVQKDGDRPVVVFDLDDTIFRTSYRTKAVLEAWAATLPSEQAAAKQGVEALDPEKMQYYLNDTLDMAGVIDPALRKSADEAWGRGFFHNDLMTEDRAIRGAPEYAHALVRAGATVVYLTARDAPRMRRGTLRQIAQRGFPKPGRRANVVLMMKPDNRIKDVEYKESVTSKIKAMGRVVASFDNEPRNLHMFRKQFPGATLVYVDTPHSKDSPPLTPAMRTIADYSR